VSGLYSACYYIIILFNFIAYNLTACQSQNVSHGVYNSGRFFRFFIFGCTIFPCTFFSYIRASTTNCSSWFSEWRRLSVYCNIIITHDDIDIFHDESWKPIYCGVKRSKVKVTSQKNLAGMGLCSLVSAGVFIVIIAWRVSGTCPFPREYLKLYVASSMIVIC